jgi:uncharacterized secreted protein with C-terminal beta-propeller domain
MTGATTSGGSRQVVTGTLGVLALAAALTIVSLVAAPSPPAAASDLEQFGSCAELEAWTGEVTRATTATTLAERLEADTPGEAAGVAGVAASADDGGTNTVVAGVDEIDVIDRVGPDRLLVSRNGALALVDLANRTVVAEATGLPFDARISVAGDTVWVAGSARDGLGTVVVRMLVQGDALAEDGRWSTPGWLLDARRSDDRFHVVVVDQPVDGTAVPFAGGPVRCEEMWHPAGEATTSAATLVASLPADGPVAPVAVAALVGSAGHLLVTADSVYLATETWSGADGGVVDTGLHRFDLATLAPTGSGSVPGEVAGRFAMSEHDGRLRVATSMASPIWMPIPVEGDGIAVASTTMPTPSAGGDEALAEVFVLDTDGALDIVGRTGRFGHDFEIIQGVRFVDDIAYVVTFRQTDPFWVVDLSVAAQPRVVGELAIPGFSAYLHPVTAGRVVGFGPDGSGSVSARLFDVTDPATPALLDEVRLGDDSPVLWDAHAYVSVADDRFAVPSTDWPEPAVCPSSGCEPTFSGGSAGAVVLGVEGGRLIEVERAEVETDGDMMADRAVLAPDGTWLLLGWDRLRPTDGGSDIVLPADPDAGVVVDG